MVETHVKGVIDAKVLALVFVGSRKSSWTGAKNSEDELVYTKTPEVKRFLTRLKKRVKSKSLPSSRVVGVLNTVVSLHELHTSNCCAF